MKIRELRVDAFGHFTGVEFGPFDQPITVFYGPNEAGKTTLLEFIRSVLFGYLDGRSSRNIYPPTAGGQRRGSLTVVTDAGESVNVQRMHGPGGGTVNLTGQGGNAIPSAELERLLGGHSRSAFEKIFGFTLDELHDDELLSDDSVNSQIYSAGMGAAKLPDALRTLEGRKGQLFLFRGSRHAIHAAAGELDEVNSTLSEVENNAAEYGRESTRLERLEIDLAELRNRRLDVESKLRHQQGLKSAWETWNDLITAQRGLEELQPISDFPSNGVGRLETLNALAAQARESADSVRALVKELEESAAHPIEHESILAESDAIQDLQRRRAAFDQSVKDVPERQAELSEMQRDLNHTLSDLGPDWDADRVARFDLSIVVREEVSNYGDRLRDALADVRRSEATRNSAEIALEEASRAVERAQTDLDDAPTPVFDETELRERRSRLRSVGITLDELDRASSRIGDLRAQLGDGGSSETIAAANVPARVPAAAVGVLGIAILVYGATLEGSATILGVIAGLGLIATAVYLFVRAGSAPAQTEATTSRRIHSQIAEVEQRLNELHGELEQQAVSLGLDSLDRHSLIAAEVSLETEQARLAERNRLSTVLRDADDLVRQRTSRRDESLRSLDSAREALASAQSGWTLWLEQRGLRQEFSPQNIEVLRSLIDLGRTRHADVVDMEKRIAAIHTDIEEFTDILMPVTAPHGFELDPNDHARAAAIADDLIHLHAAVTDRSRARAAAERGLDTAREELGVRERGLKENQDRIDALLSDADAQDDDDFHRRAEVYAERERLGTIIADATDRLQRISGPGAALEDLQSELARSNAQTIADHIRRSNLELDEIGDQVESMVSDRTTLQNSLDSLINEEESSKLRAERSRLLEDMRAHAREWAVMTIAENLLNEARGKFERERQPAVIHHSQQFFRDITGGRYQAVYSPLGTSEIQVTDSDGTAKQPAELSRGAREQLFLALRFGLIREIGERSERLPIIVDEVLVNFDPQRALRAAEGFIQVAQSNQVLVFTCHPWVVELFKNASARSGAPEPGVIEVL